MDEPVSRWPAFADAIGTDRPWDGRNARHPVFLTAVLAGLLSGLLTGAVIDLPFLEIAHVQGDAAFWDTVGCGAWLGGAAGVACGIALILTRHVFGRMTLAALMGTLTVPLALYLSSDGRLQGHWESYADPKSGLPLVRPEGWGLYLGLGWSAMMAVVAHLTRRCAGKPMLIFCTMLVGCFLAIRVQSIFWNEWDHLGSSISMEKCAGHQSKPICFPQGVVTALVPLAAFWIPSGISARIGARRRAATLTAGIALLALALYGAVQLMPFTSPSPIQDAAFTEDGRFVITAHRGNAIRWWTIEGQDGSVSLREVRKVRLAKSSEWHAPPELHLPYVSSVFAKCLRLWDIADLRSREDLSWSDGDWRSIAFSPDRHWAAMDDHQKVIVWELGGAGSARQTAEFGSPEVLRRNPPSFFLFPTHRETLSLSNSGHPSFLEPTQSREHDVSRLARFTALPLVSLADGTGILVANGEGQSYLWNAGRVGALMTFVPAMGLIHCAALSADERLLAVAESNELWILDIERGKVVFHQSNLQPAPWRMVGSPDGRWFVTSDQESLRIWRWPQVEYAP